MRYFLILVIILLINFVYTPQAYAASNPVNALNYSLFQISSGIQDQLKASQKITAAEIKKLFNQNAAVEAQTFKFQDQVMITTGSSGTAKSNMARSIYKLNVNPISGYDVSIPTSVNLNKAQLIVPVGISPGTGTVKKAENKTTLFAAVSGFFDNQVMAQDKTSQISVVTYYDKNKNGRWDRSEDIVPWAGVTVEFTDENAALKKSDSGVSFFDNIPFFKIQLGTEK